MSAKIVHLLCITPKTGRVARYMGPVVTIQGKKVFCTNAATLDEYSLQYIGTDAVRSLLERFRTDPSAAVK